ncbi:Trk-type K+ transport system membrane component [Bacillus ectoiniformans]|uniref:TrkH family potassium uptake protein n=1 Tax=Bacillus ectoiniformans TaxID=1494429 RepID=UPI00195BEB09|nr:TrkH family potassium uptake protein [Bacillus ectoiniformans]MBM7647411.1 Trk-type K+ transport system membrane component [Bacillus ectoiniformans]
MRSKIFKLTERLSTVQLIVLYYVTAVVISTILISLPISLKSNVDISLIDAIFTSVSAISVTGLSTIPINEVLSVPGTFIFAVILQFGGIGIMTLGTFFWLILGKKIGLRERKLIMTDQNQFALSGIVKLIRQILVLIITIEAIGAFILGVYFLRYFPTWQEAFLQGFFASVSATTNAGFDITGESLIPFAHDYFVQFINILLLIIGAIGFPVLIEVKEYLKYKEKVPFHFSLFAKVTTFTFFGLVVIGTILIYLFEFNHFFVGKTWHEAFFYSLFQSVTSRNGGLATMDVNDFSIPTLVLLCILMFIGASPSSVGGGIRTTTFAIMVLSIYSYARGQSRVKVFKREIVLDDIVKSYIVISTAVMICSLAVMVLAYIEPQFSLMEIMFEVSSAFGTTGLSMGITADLSIAGKAVIIVLMFIGRIGIFSFLFLIRGVPEKEKYRYPKERIIIG